MQFIRVIETFNVWHMFIVLKRQKIITTLYLYYISLPVVCKVIFFLLFFSYDCVCLRDAVKSQVWMISIIYIHTTIHCTRNIQIFPELHTYLYIHSSMHHPLYIMASLSFILWHYTQTMSTYRLIEGANRNFYLAPECQQV